MKTGIIIPIYNMWKELTEPCLESIKKHTPIADMSLIVCDNASTDINFHEINAFGKRLFGNNFYYLRNSVNLGFSAACNQGADTAKQIGCDYLFFLNNDTLVAQNWFDPLFQAIQKDSVGIAGPLLLYPDNTVQHCGVVYTVNGHLKHIYQHFPANHSVIFHTSEYRALTGAAFLTRTCDFFRLGKFCEEFKNGFEDIDLCYRYANEGLHCEVAHRSTVYHLESRSPGRLNQELVRHNQEIFVKRNKFLKPDAHVHYEQDGYVPSLTKEYYFYVSLSEDKRQKIFDQITAHYSDGICYSMLMQEPYWQDGYFLLAESLIKKKLFKEAQNCCDLAFKFGFIFDELFEKYLYCAEKSQTAEEYRHIKERIREMRDERISLSKPNQLRLKVLVDETWRKKLFLTRKNPIFLGDAGCYAK